MEKQQLTPLPTYRLNKDWQLIINAPDAIAQSSFAKKKENYYASSRSNSNHHTFLRLIIG
jgi:hypothetical protein